jgi:hypothetical protein
MSSAPRLAQTDHVTRFYDVFRGVKVKTWIGAA